MQVVTGPPSKARTVVMSEPNCSDEAVSTLKRLLIPSAALLWGLQFAFLNPALALLLVVLFDATAAEVGWVLAVYNGSGFVASLVLPAYADRKGNYLWPLLACGLLTLALAVLLYATTSSPSSSACWCSAGRPASAARYFSPP